MTSILSWQSLVAMFALGVVVAVALVVGLFLFLGLFQARSLIRRELAAYFVSPIAYVVLVVFLFFTGLLFFWTLNLLTEESQLGVEYPMQAIFGHLLFWGVYLFIPPLLTMRLFAEERSTGTLETLMTAPLRDWQVVLSKYLACFVFYVFMFLPTLAYLPILLNLGQPSLNPVITFWSVTLFAGLGCIALAVLLVLLPLGTASRWVAVVLLAAGIAGAAIGGWNHYLVDSEYVLVMPAQIDPRPVWSTYLGLALAGAMFLSLGMLVSSLVRSQMIAALISIAVGLVFIALGIWRASIDVNDLSYPLAAFLGVPSHFDKDFCRGVVDTRHVVLYISVALFGLFLTVRSLESRRWR